MLLALFRQQVVVCDVHLFLLGVAGNLDDFEAVAQRRRQLIQLVCGTYEEHFGKIEGHFQVMVRERVVLLRVQDFEKSGFGIAGPVASQFVDLIEQDDGIFDLGLLQGGD